jgi:hypothetical protein
MICSYIEQVIGKQGQYCVSRSVFLIFKNGLDQRTGSFWISQYFTVRQNIPRLLRNPMIPYHVHKMHYWTLLQGKLIHNTHTRCCFKPNHNMIPTGVYILQVGFVLQGFPTKMLVAIFLVHSIWSYLNMSRNGSDIADNLYEPWLELGVIICSITLQVLFRKVTGKNLVLPLRRRLILHLLLPVCLGFVVVILNIYDQYVPVWRMPSFYILLLQSDLCFVLRQMEYHALQLSSVTFVRRFKVKTSRTMSMFWLDDS